LLIFCVYLEDFPRNGYAFLGTFQKLELMLQ
jgi:hypothetical protein